MPPSGASVPAVKPGPELPPNWRGKFLEAYRTRGGLWRAAKAVGISHETVRRYRNAEPDFDQQVKDAREEYADQLEEQMIASAERSDNPAGFIVRLKALRPHEYVEKYAVMNFNVTAEVGGEDAVALLKQMLGDASAPTQALLQPPHALPEALP